MCRLMTTADMPTNTNGGSGNRKQYIAWFPKPNKEGENARVRLLWFLAPEKNTRNTPYFVQMVHDHWGVNDKGANIVDDTIVCPSTKYSKYDEEKWIKNDKTGKNEVNCPICRKEKEAMAVWKNSGWKDRVAMKRHFALQPKFRAIIPVYVIHDPNNSKNDGHPKVMILTNKDDFEMFDRIVKTEKAKAYAASQNGNPYEIFNGKNGVDLYLHCETVEEPKKNGFVQKVRRLTGIAFDDPSSKYDITEINRDMVDSFDMDGQYYVSNTRAELEDFYGRHYAKDETVIPKENTDIFKKMKSNAENVQVPPLPKVDVSNPVPKTEPDMLEIPKDEELPAFEDIDNPSQSTYSSETESSQNLEEEDPPDVMNEIMDELEKV